MISGTGNLTVNAGTLSLGANNTYSGTTTINAGDVNAVVNGSLMYAKGPWEADLTVDNLTDAFYVTPDQDVLANIGALPGRGREWRITVKRRF